MRVVEITPNQIIENVKKIRLAAYCRVSSDSKDQLNSFTSQIKYYTDYTKKNPQYELVEIYADEGLTGTDMKRRNEFNRLLDDCKKRNIDRVITKSASRFARNTQDFLVVIRMLKELGISVYFEEQAIDTSKMNMEMFATFPGLIAQQESESISQNMRWSYQKRMQSGEFNTQSAPYGYILENGELNINESEALIVRRIFDLYLSGEGKQRIANMLNEEKVPLRYKAKNWYVSTINYILNNERYMGDALLQKSYMTETLPFRKVRNRGEKAQYYVENSNPPIISKETFEAAQRMQNSRTSNNEMKKNNYPLSRKIRCSECGRTYRRTVVNDIAYWLCSSRASGVTDCTFLRIKETDIYNTFNKLVLKLKDNREDIILSTIKYIKSMQEKSSESQQKIFEIDKQIANLTAQNHTLTKFHTKGILDSISYTEQSSAVSDKIMNLRVERRRILHESEEYELIENLKHLDILLKDYNLSTEFDEELFEEIVKKIVLVSNNELNFTLLGGLNFNEMVV